MKQKNRSQQSTSTSNRTATRRFLSLLLAMALMLTSLTGTSLSAQAAENNVITKTYGDYTFTKISNPGSGSGQPDGINTNDLTGYPANRLNSYAWAVTSRGNNIYIGTNRTLFGSALNAVAELQKQMNPNLSEQMLGSIIDVVSGGEVPVNLSPEEYVPQIIKFDVEDGTTEVIYEPQTALGEDGILYYVDRDGAIIPDSDVASETASFRSVVQYKGNLYFGSLGSNMLQLVRIDENDNADVVFQSLGIASSLRAGCIYDDGEMETVYYGGQDTGNPTWRQYRQANPDKAVPLPIVIRYLNPETAGTEQEDWSGLIADFSDFGKYSFAGVYANGGGNVWDLCSYNGKLYLILAYDGGWAMFRGEKGGAAPNKYGWTWTEVVGDNGAYPLAMNSEISELNEKYRVAYGCSEYGAVMNGRGLLESTATPYVFNGKMYIGSFDNATLIQAQTVTKIITKVRYLENSLETGEVEDLGPTLTQIYAPIYEALSRPQHLWVMDENETITPVEQANELLAGTTNDYVWRFIEHDGKFYMGTFDSSSAYIYFLDYSRDRIMSLLREYRSKLPEYFKALLDGTFSRIIASLMGEARSQMDEKDIFFAEYEAAAVDASASLESFLSGDDVADQLCEDMSALESVQMKLEEDTVRAAAYTDSGTAKITQPNMASIPRKAYEMVRWLLQMIDVEGIQYWAKARALAKNAESGFDLFVTEDGENWEKIVGDGLDDPYNYGARTFTICEGDLYLGTANPYYGAQLWKVSSDKDEAPTTDDPAVENPTTEDPAVENPAIVRPKPISNLWAYKGKLQNLVSAGKNVGRAVLSSLNNKTDHHIASFREIVWHIQDLLTYIRR